MAGTVGNMIIEKEHAGLYTSKNYVWICTTNKSAFVTIYSLIKLDPMWV